MAVCTCGSGCMAGGVNVVMEPVAAARLNVIATLQK